jgi:signal transduction histidine kinase
MTVADTGRGIPAEDVPHIFERFFRRSRTTSDKSATGFGLGLSIVKWIVDAHGGTISAESQVGRGTTFTVRFPLEQGPAAPPERRNPTSPESPPLQPSPH